MVLFSHLLIAEEKKISIAIVDFRANNTDPAIGSACADMLAERLFSSKLFILMEKTQMDRIARKNGFYEFDSTDPEQIRKLGKILKVDKLMAGSITLLDEYIVNVKVFNALTGQIDYTVEKRVGAVEKLDDVMDEISSAVERHYLGYYDLDGVYELDAEFLYIIPLGTMANAVDQGMGGQVFVTFNNPRGMPADLQVMAGCCSFVPACDEIGSYTVVPVYVSCARRFSPARNIRFIPAAGLGYIFTYVSADTNGFLAFFEGV